MVSSLSGDRMISLTLICRFPEAQAKAQKELDTLLGHGNLRESSSLTSISFII